MSRAQPPLMSTTLREGFGTVRAKLALLLRRRIGSQREDGDFDRIVRYKVIQIWSISTFGLITMFTISLFTWLEYSPTHGYDAYYNDPDVPSKVLDSMYVAQALITLSTVVTIVLISQKYNLLLRAQQRRHPLDAFQEEHDKPEHDKGEDGCKLEADLQVFVERHFHGDSDIHLKRNRP